MQQAVTVRSWNKYIAMMAERKSKNIADKYIGFIPHSGIFIVPPNTCMYLKGNMKSVNSHQHKQKQPFCAPS